MADYFLGGASPNGFKTEIGKMIYDSGYFTYILKGTPGCGKSSFMKSLIKSFPGEEIDRFYCSSDPDSLDAVMFKDRGIIIVDGTSPHSFEPLYPLAYQTIINMNSFMNQDILFEKRSEIKALTDECNKWHERCRRYLAALSAINDDMTQIGKSALLVNKADGFTERISRKLLPRRQSAGKCGYRTLTALTPKGLITFIPEDYSVYMLYDDLFYASDRFLRAFEENAVKKGLNVTVGVSYNHSSPMYRHMIIPEIKTAFIWDNGLTDKISDNFRKISFKRFYDKTEIMQKKLRLKFDKGARDDLLCEAKNSLASAKSVHDELEKIYLTAVNFPAEERYLYKIISEIKSRNVKEI